MGKSKYFSESKRNKDKKIIPSTATLAGDYINATDVFAKVKEKVNLLTMQLIESGEDLLGMFDSASVDAIPDDLIDDGETYMRIEDYIIPQNYNAPNEGGLDPILEKEVSVVVSKIIEFISLPKNYMVNGLKYYGLIKNSGGEKFYPRIIRYDNGNAFGKYDMKLVGLPDNERMTASRIVLRKIS